MPKRPSLTEAAADAAIMVIVLGLMAAAAFVGWVVGNYAGNETKTVTVGTTSAQATTAETTTEAATTTAATTPTTTTSGGNTGTATSGKAIFTSAGCASCHTLQAAGSHGTIGPNLDERRPSKDKVVERVTEGKGVMPSFKGQLTDAQIQSVAAFVSSSTRGSSDD